jgi:hypothetical protein
MIFENDLLAIVLFAMGIAYTFLAVSALKKGDFHGVEKVGSFSLLPYGSRAISPRSFYLGVSIRSLIAIALFATMFWVVLK